MEERLKERRPEDGTTGKGGGTTPPSQPAPPVNGISCQQLADVVKGGITSSTPEATANAFYATCSAVAQGMGIEWLVDFSLNTFQAVSVARNYIVDALDHGAEVCAIGLTRGYLLPDDPRPRLAELNRVRQLFGALRGIEPDEQTALVTAALGIVRVGQAYDSGLITFDRQSPAAQLASFDVSVDGISSQSGNALADILGYQPDGDFVKRKRALDALAKLDFSRRKPYLLFTADVIRDGRRSNGTIVAWGRMRDASGYNITKRDVFAIVDYPSINLSNEFLQVSTAELMRDHEFQQLLGFYDWLNPGDVFAFVDDQTSADTLFSYSINGVQRRAPSSPALFDVPMSALYLSPGQTAQVRSGLAGEVGRTGSIESVSPYPALANVVYGDPGYGWIIAGCNVLAAKRRGDTTEQVRAMSFIGSRAEDLLAAVAAGRIVVPSDAAQVHSAIDASIASYGVSQTILGVLDGVGLTSFSPGKDDPLGIQSTQESLERATGGLAKILSAIDPQTATVDPLILSAALSTQSSIGSATRYASGQIRESDVARSRTSFSAMAGTAPIDLTTYEGISRLMQLLRAIYDFYPGALS